MHKEYTNWGYIETSTKTTSILYLWQHSKQLQETSYTFRMGIHLISQPVQNATISPVFWRDMHSQSCHSNANLKWREIDFSQACNT